MHALEMSIEAETLLDGVTLQVGSFDWTPDASILLTTPDYTLTLLLSPRHRFSRGGLRPRTARRPPPISAIFSSPRPASRYARNLPAALSGWCVAASRRRGSRR